MSIQKHFEIKHKLTPEFENKGYIRYKCYFICENCGQITEKILYCKDNDMFQCLNAGCYANCFIKSEEPILMR